MLMFLNIAQRLTYWAELIAPEYPTADAFKPTTDWEESTPPELVLMKLLRQIVDSEMSLVSDTYKGEFEFVSDAAANVCRKFLAETNDRVAERLDSGEAMKPVQVSHPHLSKGDTLTPVYLSLFQTLRTSD